MELPYGAVNGNGFLGNNGHLTPRNCSPRLSWLDLRVFYVRISKCEIDDSTPEHLTLNHIPLDPNTLLEINGVRASIYSDGVSTLLRRDRLDKKSEEATYVSTDSIRITGSVKFEVFDRDVLVLSGSLTKCDSNGFIDGSESDHVSRMWSMNCETDATVGTGFLKGKQLVVSELASPNIEVYVAGCYLGTPIMLTKSLHLNSRRKQVRMAMLNSIPEHDTTESEKESPPRLPVQVENEGYSNLYSGTEYFEGEDGELSFFNAGVRVGVGIGLSVCLGIGIGVGLLVKTYQGTTRTFRRRFF
ncbi:hypothetical protein BVRB_9g217500 [Beta vulgaris subsp. vulgaris]|uniref:uncharacterized protein At1g01500 n=1 Tax=Beta vulgaris subsp. vulgaris TaxID=3555 RepID=UPI00053FB47A|nr:uncharacterized protein At1g01500 [Beta vulgaris subsp. vulgaris]XP_019107551.1 uncharacterized protein At1g01500 [Beta vulgaris subsp. vulgaris]KMT00449.1 hypothetical protein BVRB_9g217500 [Beta vulgaris subsp. vulgaris]